MFLKTFSFLAVIFCQTCATCSGTRPHIIFIFADDLGWNDISLHGSPEIPTPNIDALAAGGIAFARFYAAPLCTPSRASLMTGYYPSFTGLQHGVIPAGGPFGLPLEFKIIPQHFKDLGYKTHGVGKWHLGYYKKKYTPTCRGFDSYFGCWNGQIDHYDYTNLERYDLWGVDLHDGLKPVKHFRGKFAGETFTDKAVDIIKRHNPSKPLFLYLSHVIPHVGNAYKPLQAPPEQVAKVKYITNQKRRIFAGSVLSLDESVGKVFAALNATRMLDNSIVLFVSDNGGEIAGERGGQGSNYPLRGSKAYLWEGGVRVPAVIWSPLLNLQKPRVSLQYMHITDWLPTLYSAAGGNVKDLGKIDGIDMWNYLVNDLPTTRREIFLNVDIINGMSALIQGDYKVVNGTYPLYGKDFWYGPTGREDLKGIPSLDEWVFKNGSTVKEILEKSGRWLIKKPDKWRRNLNVNCGAHSPPPEAKACNSTIAPCLFNITEDPCEYRNLASKKPKVVDRMMERIRQLTAKSRKPLNVEVDPRADPYCHGFVFVPWLDRNHAKDMCDIPKVEGKKP